MHDKYAIVVSDFNTHITSKLLDGALERLKAEGISSDDITVVHVPGAVEVPYAAQLLAKQKKYVAILCYGAVIQGDTDHYDYVCQQVSYGCQRVMLDHNIPIIFGILTTQNEQQALDRTGGKVGHLGKEYAGSALKMVELTKKLI